MKISIKDYLMLLSLIIITLFGLYLLQKNKYSKEEEIIDKQFCFDMYKNTNNEINEIYGICGRIKFR